MARYVPKHRKRRQYGDQRAIAGLAAVVLSSAIMLSGTAGFVPGVQAEIGPNPFLAEGVGIDQGAGASATQVAGALRSTNQSPVLSPLVAAREHAPTYVEIPAIGSTSSLIRLGLLPDGTLDVPVEFSQAGWYEMSATPGDPGPSVIVGHVDSYAGPGIFSNLSKLKPDDIVRVARRDGEILTYAVRRVDQYPKDLFPTSLVYGDTTESELRLITCGGKFNSKVRSYEANTVVYASLVKS